MDGLLEGLQSTAFANWVLVSMWGYPILLTLHSLGLALLVGVLVVIDLRVLGLARSIPLPPLGRLMSLVWLALAVNALSGIAIFMSDAVRYYYSTGFRLKLLSVVLGVTLAVMLSSSVLDVARRFDRADMPMTAWAKGIAVCSILLWLAAIGTGRWMAYE